eukprot:21321-Eustigmatos_ZCMA.PRE.1
MSPSDEVGNQTAKSSKHKKRESKARQLSTASFSDNHKSFSGHGSHRHSRDDVPSSSKEFNKGGEESYRHKPRHITSDTTVSTSS